jgi:hypothetical protein
MLENVRRERHAFGQGDTMAIDAAQNLEVHELTEEEGFALLDRQAQRYLGMSARDFIAAWDAGKFAQNGAERPEVVRLAMLLPLGR